MHKTFAKELFGLLYLLVVNWQEVWMNIFIFVFRSNLNKGFILATFVLSKKFLAVQLVSYNMFLSNMSVGLNVII